MRVLITGASGFTAGHLVRRLRREPDCVITGSGRKLDPARVAELDAFHPADVSDPSQIAAVVRQARPDWIFHLAGLVRGTAPEIYRANVLATVNLLEAVKQESPAASVLVVGSAAEYGIWPATEMPLGESHPCVPRGAYALSKHAMTQIALDYAQYAGVKVVVARPFNLIGAGVPPTLVIGALLERARMALKNGDASITVGNTTSQRDFIAVEDAVEAYLALLKAEPWGEVFNICSGEAQSIDSALALLLSFSPRPVRVTADPSLQRANDAPLVVGDPGKINRVCGFRPQISFAQALRSAFDAAMNERPRA